MSARPALTISRSLKSRQWDLQRSDGDIISSTHASTTSSSYRVSVYVSYRSLYANWSIATYFFYPETSGRHLEEVDQIFRDSKNIFDPPKMAKRLPVHKLADAENSSDKMKVENKAETDADASS